MIYNKFNGAMRDLICAIVYLTIGAMFGISLSIIYIGGF